MSEFSQPHFRPFPLFASCHLQTIVASLLSFSINPSSVTQFVYLPDGDRMTYEVNTPPDWKSTDPTVIMIHGLCGSYRSHYNVRIAKKLSKRCLRTIRINLRGCGTGKGYARRVYHVDGSDDIWYALNKIKREEPNSPFIVVGFSFGGNMLLKMAGEWEEEAKKLISKVIAVNPPIDMTASVQLLSNNKIYERYFMRYLRLDVAYRHNYFHDLPPIEIPKKMTLLEFEEFYIAPQAGYDSVKDYYHAVSAGRLIPKIRVKAHILFSKDDPIVDCQMIRDIQMPSNIEVMVTEKGGHLGYLGMPGEKGGFHWMDTVLLDWIFS